MMILFWVILLFLAVFTFSGIFQTDTATKISQEETALDALKKRLATGEIDLSEFKEKSKYL